MNEKNSGINILHESIKEKNYWEENLSGVLIKSNFPYDTIQKGKKDYNKEKVELNLSKEAFWGLQKLSNDSHYKLHVLLVASLNVMLYKYSGYGDIIIGSPIYKQKTEGRFINTFLPFRNTVKGDITFKQLLLQVRDTILNANENQNYPVESIINKLNIQVDDMKRSLLDVLVIVENIHYKKYIEHISSNMTFVFSVEKNDVLLSIEYNSNLYTKSTVKRIALSLDHTIKAITNDVHKKVKDINVLSPEQNEEILIDFNRKQEVNDKPKLIQELFEEQVIKTPNNIAIEIGSKTITYKALNEKANQLARTLREKELNPNDIVGIMIEPSIELAIGLMAILKAGATYLPLDPRYPVDRLKFMVEDSKVEFILSDSNYSHVFRGNIKILDITDQAHFSRDRSNLSILQGREDLAYIIYTSGSTGKPKGVMVEHRTVCKTILWRKDEYGLKPDHAVLQLVSYSFDAFIGGFFAPIVSGSKIVLLNNDEIKNINIIRKYIKEKKITHLHGVPLLISIIMEHISDEEANSLKTITVGGDRTPPNLINICLEKDIELVNEYGPTENTIISTIFRNMNNDSISKIGKPIYDTDIYILDQDNNLCPIGVTGEICISGGRLARGYLNRPQLTAKKFVKNPFKQDGVMYKTGDLAKWCEDGNIDFIGRKDFQVKIRGFRVELGEIEAKLLACSYIKQAVVIARGLENGGNYLSAYFVSDKKVTNNELVSYLSNELPEYMIPSYFMQIQDIPVTANGKIDRESLPLANSKINTVAEYVEPRNDIEEKIAEVWKIVLGARNIGIYDNFFSVGGDSLKAIRAASMLSERFHIEINDIYKYQTIQMLAAKIDYLSEDLVTRITTYKREIAAMEEEQANTEKNKEIEGELTDQYNLYMRKIEKYKDLNLEETINYKNILLTGATGYVGMYLLRELINFTDSTIYLLVRGKNIKEAEKRIKQKVDFYFGLEFYGEISDRIKILAGDISERYFGLEESNYEALSMEIDCIINSAAYVKHYGDYERFYNINVKGTKNLMEFSRIGKKKDYNHISTTTISDGNIDGIKRGLFTEYETDIGQKSNSYYSQTKLESEKVVIDASRNDINIKIFRLGNVSFNYETGTFQENIDDNAINKMLKSYIKLKVFPYIDAKMLNFSYVDQLAKSIILLFNKKALNNEIFHIYNPHQVSIVDIANLLKEKYNFIKVKSLGEFLEFISDNIYDEELRPYIDNVLMYMDIENNKNSTELISLNEKTNYILDKMDFKWDELDDAAINRMIQYWRKVNFM
ncbi:non-ribosomal peptide synthetase family protein [Bacillus cereus]|uniref:Amino acid adenylation domain-containing protein n=1 Tax=Bacillus cereus HuA2-1 TaxID=1053201 RepID=J9CRB1_BACCE|nr:non-ribosomal peptide synthetase [Bacillus cereus]EJV87817.1 amino acid adenylation domain-containing protein [Bacillus cereus HuA2-1]